MNEHFEISQHAQEQLDERLIPPGILDSVLRSPEQIVSERGGRKAYQSLVNLGGRAFLVRAIVDPGFDPPLVVTVYRTTRISKYWRPNESNL